MTAFSVPALWQPITGLSAPPLRSLIEIGKGAGDQADIVAIGKPVYIRNRNSLLEAALPAEATHWRVLEAEPPD